MQINFSGRVLKGLPAAKPDYWGLLDWKIYPQRKRQFGPGHERIPNRPDSRPSLHRKDPPVYRDRPLLHNPYGVCIWG